MRLVALAMLALALPAVARPPVVPEKLTPEALKAHVAKYLADPARKSDLKEFTDKLILSAEGLTWTAKPERQVVTWTVPVKKGAKLSATEQKLFPDALKDVLQMAVRDGLVTSDATIDYRVRLQTGDEPKPGTEPPARPVTPEDARPIIVPAVPRMGSQYVWTITPLPCGSPSPALFDISEVPVPILPPAVWHGYWSADEMTIEIPPRMPRATVSRPTRPLERLPVAGLKKTDGDRLFFIGRKMYERGEMESAAQHLRAAATLNPNDVRAWYFLALSERERGDKDAADEARAEGARLQAMDKMKASDIGRALERVQGVERMWLREALESRPMSR